MPNLNIAAIESYRATRWRLKEELRLHSLNQAANYIQQIGILAFWPLKNIAAPSLWYAAAGDRPVPDNHDDPGHITWGWKDDLLGDKRFFYGRILNKRTFFVTRELLPHLYALSNNFGNYAEDHLILYQEGKLTNPARSIYDAILLHGPLDTIELHRITHLTGKQGDLEFNKAMDTLQMDFKLMPVGISNSGRWHYSMIYDIVARHFPTLIDQAGVIPTAIARSTVLSIFLESAGAVRRSQIHKLFRWPEDQLQKAILSCLESGPFLADVADEESGWKDWIAKTDLVLQ